MNAPSNGSRRAIFKGNPQRLVAFKSGEGGISQMRDALDDKDVCFGLLRVPIGSGKGEKCKHCFILFTGDGVGSVRCPVPSARLPNSVLRRRSGGGVVQVKRGQAAVNKDAVQTALGVRIHPARPSISC